MTYFKNINLSFEYEGHLISGILNGDLKNWQFISQDEFFRRYFPKGILFPRISFNPSKINIDGILNSFYKEADKLIQ